MQGTNIEIGGKSYLFKFTLNNLADMEAQANKTVMDMLTGHNEVSFAPMRLFFLAGLRHAPYRGLTLEMAGQLLSDYLDGGRTMQEALTLVVTTLEACGFIKNQRAGAEETVPTPA